jgi:uncharacterized protein DUF5715
MVLSILRADLLARNLILGLLLAGFVTVSAIPSSALQARAHRRYASSSSPHRHPQLARTRSTRTSASRVRDRASSYTTVRRRSVRRQPAVFRARMPIRQYSWMSTRSAAHSARSARYSVSEAVATPAIDTDAQSPRAGVPTPATSIAEAEVSDAADTNTPTPQDAADKIAAAEMPAPHAALAAPSMVAATDPLRSTRIFAMAPLRGSLESLIRQNEKTNADNLERIENDADLRSRIMNGQLVRVPESEALAVNANLPLDRRYCRPWTAAFLTDLSRAHQAQFHHAFEVSSAVRTVEYQKRLMRTNGNAAPAEGDVASPHLTGATIDIAKHGLTRSELYWMRDRLNSLQSEGKIDVEEEFHQSCFHITVYKSYVGAGPLHKTPRLVKAPPTDDDTPSVAGAATPGA